MQACPGEATKARCKVCGTVIQAHMKSIKDHASGKKYLENMKSSGSKQTSILGGMHTIKHACPTRCMIKQFENNLRVCGQVGRFDKLSNLPTYSQIVFKLFDHSPCWTSIFDSVYPALQSWAVLMNYWRVRAEENSIV